MDKLLESQPFGENYTDIDKTYLQFGVADIFPNLLVHTGPHSFEQFFTDKGEQKIQSQEWVTPDPPEEYDGKPVIMTSQLFVEVQLKDNPFVKVSPTTKHYKLLERSETKLHLKILNKCTSIPYCDTFSVEEEWLFMAPTATANCCVVRHGVQIIFYKNTLFKSKITSETLKASKKVMQDWVDFIKKRNL